MNIIYNTCNSDPWIIVANELLSKYNIKPVYWIGYDDDNSEELVKQYFPEIVYHKYFDAWKGIFPEKATGNKEQLIDIDFLKDYSSFELQALRMMDRMDPDQHSFSVIERQRHFRNILRNWNAVIENLKPEAVISAIIPHRVYDYALFLLCNFKKIPFLSFKNTAFTGRIIPVTGIYNIEPSITADYHDLKGKLDSPSLMDSLPKDIYQEYHKVKKDYSIAEPQYMKRHIQSSRNDSSLIGITKKFIGRVYANKKLFFGKNGYILKGIPTYLKRKNSSIEKSSASILHHALRKHRNNRFKQQLKKHYESLVESPQYDENYIFLPLHYQPEMTSNPSGDIFVDQFLCIDTLSSGIPNNYKIYVKEHKAQFYAHTEGHTSRIKEFYDDLVKFPNIKLISLEEDVFELISNSVAVATVTGTAGWEAMVRAKPVIIFGLAWYEGYEGVLKIRNQNDANNIQSFIENFSFNENNLLTYLLAFSKNSTRAYYYKGLKGKMNQPEKECIDNLASEIENMLCSEKV
jgi:hypothetical protein